MVKFSLDLSRAVLIKLEDCYIIYATVLYLKNCLNWQSWHVCLWWKLVGLFLTLLQCNQKIGNHCPWGARFGPRPPRQSCNIKKLQEETANNICESKDTNSKNKLQIFTFDTEIIYLLNNSKKGVEEWNLHIRVLALFLFD